MESGLRSDPARWRDRRQRRGVEAELAAAAFLRSEGWTVLAHRFRVGRHDVDLVARRGRTVAFVEVRSRVGEAFGAPQASVTRKKQDQLCAAARAWVKHRGLPGDTFRFDVIGMARGAVTWIQDAFRPGWR